MSTAENTYVRARINTNIKERAAITLKAMGLWISNVIRPVMLRIADEQRLTFDVKVPTKKAIAEMETGRGKNSATITDLVADLHADY